MEKDLLLSGIYTANNLSHARSHAHLCTHVNTRKYTRTHAHKALPFILFRTTQTENGSSPDQSCGWVISTTVRLFRRPSTSSSALSQSSIACEGCTALWWPAAAATTALPLNAMIRNTMCLTALQRFECLSFSLLLSVSHRVSLCLSLSVEMRLTVLQNSSVWKNHRFHRPSISPFIHSSVHNYQPT